MKRPIFEKEYEWQAQPNTDSSRLNRPDYNVIKIKRASKEQDKTLPKINYNFSKLRNKD